MYAFIDESGDPGTGGRGSRWLAVACAIVKDGSKTNFEQSLRDIAARVTNGAPLHFVKLSHMNKRAAYQRLQGFGGVVALSDTTKPVSKHLEDALTHYHYALKEVLRRVLWQANFWHETPTIFIDRREGRFDLERFKAYLAELDRDADPYTDWSLLDLERILTAEPNDELCLCLADGLAHAAFIAMEPNSWSGPETAYLEMCARSLWRPQFTTPIGEKPPTILPPKGLLGNGLILLPEAETWAFMEEFPWLLEWQARK